GLWAILRITSEFTPEWARPSSTSASSLNSAARRTCGTVVESSRNRGSAYSAKSFMAVASVGLRRSRTPRKWAKVLPRGTPGIWGCTDAGTQAATCPATARLNLRGRKVTRHEGDLPLLRIHCSGGLSDAGAPELEATLGSPSAGSAAAGADSAPTHNDSP